MPICLPKGCKREDLTSDIFAQYLYYNKESGSLFWKTRNLDLFATIRSGKVWNTRYANKPAGGISTTRGIYKSYSIRFGPHFMRVHRVIAVMSGMMEKYGEPWEIDHINGDATDNRLDNLRLVTRTENMRNSRKKSDSKTKVCGVSYESREKKWRVDIGRGTEKGGFIGYFENWFEAVCVRKSKEVELGYTDRHGKKL